MSDRIVVIGASMGGIETLGELLPILPGDFPTPIALVVHTSRMGGGQRLSRVLERNCQLKVLEARDQEKMQPGRVYLPPSDHHLLVQDGLLRASRGPRENNSRPAIDPLFRSAAYYAGSGCVGVLLSGLLDDGSCGLVDIQRCGGTTIVQDPAEALYPDMPANAIRRRAPDHILAVAAIGTKLLDLCTRPDGALPTAPPADLATEVHLTQRAMGLRDHAHDMERSEQIGQPVPITCPDCGGCLWQVGDHFRCHVGHAYSPETLLAAQDSGLEQALWAAVRSLEEKRKTLEKIGASGNIESVYLARAEEAQRYADRIRELLLYLHPA